jgi:preprotein translocase subunit SecG
MYYLATILIVIASLILILLVVIQNSKGGGLAAGFASSNQVMGVRKTTDFLEKATWGFAGVVVVLSIIASLSFRTSSHSASEVDIREDIENMAPAADPNATAPFGTPVAEPEE